MKVLRRWCAAWYVLALGTALWWGQRSAGSVVSLLWGVLLLAAFTLLPRGLSPRAAKRCFLPAVCLTASAYALLSLWFARVYHYTPLFDPEAVLQGAQAWKQGDLLSGGSATYQASTYFYYFPNNLGAVAVLRLWLEITGELDPYAAACLLNGILSMVMILFTALAAREMGGERAGVQAMWIFLWTPPLFLSAPAFYTDFLSIAFPVGMLFAAVRADRAKSKSARAAWLGLWGVLAAVGSLIKVTVLVMAVACVLWQMLRLRWRQAGALLLAAALWVGGANFALQKAVYPGQLDRETAKAMNTPIEHWIMMGLEGNGAYNGADYDFTRSFTDTQARKAALREAIWERMREKGPIGLLVHCAKKTGLALSDGTLMLSDYYDDFPEGPEKLKDLLLPGGRLYESFWKPFCNGSHLAMLLLALAWGVQAWSRREEEMAGAMRLAVAGLLLFLSMWEASPRYWINFFPVVALCAAMGSSAKGPVWGGFRKKSRRGKSEGRNCLKQVAKESGKCYNKANSTQQKQTDPEEREQP